MALFLKAQKIVGRSEGGYQDNPNDSGNYYNGKLIGTNWGISAPTLAKFLGREPSRSDMINLTKEEAEKILFSNYWIKNRFDRLKNQSVATLLYDGAVNHGNSSMRVMVQKLLLKLKKSISQHKVFTSEGIRMINRLDQELFFELVKKSREKKYASLSSSKHFLKGWLMRLDRIKYSATFSIMMLIPYLSIPLLGFSIFLIV